MSITVRDSRTRVSSFRIGNGRGGIAQKCRLCLKTLLTLSAGAFLKGIADLLLRQVAADEDRTILALFAHSPGMLVIAIKHGMNAVEHEAARLIGEP